MRVTIKKWEVERVKEIVSEILELWSYDSVSASTSDGREISMSAKTFLESIEKELNDSTK